jgi:hypothetical protein
VGDLNDLENEPTDDDVVEIAPNEPSDHDRRQIAPNELSWRRGGTQPHENGVRMLA